MLEDAAAFAQKNPGVDRASDLALSFHKRIIAMITEQCVAIREKTGARQVALTGGTFQNKILMEGVLKELRERDFDVYYNISVSPNDGGIALGQAFIGMHII
jgi:hydrogenase maturation protein HypF